MNPNFKTWLIEEYGLADSAANSRVANILTVERHYGDIDELIRNGGAQTLLNELSYSTEDERNGIPQKHRIPIHGNIRTGSATLKQAVKKYLAFYSKCENKIEVLQEQAIVDIENMETEVEAVDFVKSIFDILEVTRLESVHTSFLKWLLGCSRDYPSILEYLIRSILKKAENTYHLVGCSDEVKGLMTAENSYVDLKKVTSESKVTYNDKSKKGEQNAYVDLVVDVSVNDQKLKIIIENKVFSPEQNNQTKIYRAYFSGDDSEIVEYGLQTYKKNLRYQKGEKKNQPKKLRVYDGDNEENQIFVFLHPDSYDLSSMAKNLSKYFIKYTYQDLLEDVIWPALENGAFSSEERVCIADYVGLLIHPDDKGRIMAEESDASKNLLEFKAVFETYTFAESHKENITDKTQSGTYDKIADDAYLLLDKIEDETQIRKVERRVPGWLRKPHQVNSRILSLFMELSDNGKNGVFLDLLEDEFDTKYPEERGNFTKNYNQMKNYSYNNHAKVFSEDEEKTVMLWEPVRDFIIKTFCE